MKIFFLTRSLDLGGAERQLVILAKELQKRGHSITVLVFYPNGVLEKELHEAGVSVGFLNKRGRWDVIGFIFRLAKMVSKERPQILHSYLVVPNIIAVILKMVFPMTRIVWGVRASNMDLSKYDWLSRLSYYVQSLLSRFADLIIVNSYSGLEHASKNGVSKKKMIVIPNGIDTNIFKPDYELRKKLRKEWGVNDNDRLIGLVGRLDPMKDHPTFLKAAALMLHEKNMNVKFVCVGDGPKDYREKLYRLSFELGIKDNIIWAGSREDMPAVYNSLDLLCLSSYGEGFPNVIGEAMACGVPCVATDVGDSAIIVSSLCEVVPIHNPEKMVYAIKNCLNRFNNKTAPELLRKRILQKFSVDNLAMTTENEMKRVLIIDK